MGEQSNVASRRAPVSESLREPANPRRRLLKTVRHSTQIADWVFRASVLACAFAILVIVSLIVYELVSGSRQALQAFGLGFLTSSDWDPVMGSFGALPFIYGTLVSSLLALVLGGSAVGGSGGFHHGNESPGSACPAGFHHGTAGGDPQRDLRLVGDLCPGAAAAHGRAAVAGGALWLDRTVRRPALRNWHAGGGNDPGHHGGSDYCLHYPRGDFRGAAAAAGSCAGAGSDPLGDDPGGSAAQRARGHSWAASFSAWGAP